MRMTAARVIASERGGQRERKRKERTIDRYNTKMESLGNWPAQSLTVQGN